MIRRQFEDWYRWLRGQIVELEDYARQLRECVEIARDTDKSLKGAVYKVTARYIEAYTDELRDKLRAGTRKHHDREYKRKHKCEKCGKTVGPISIDEDGTRLCTMCAMEEHGLRSGAPCCGYCGSEIDGDELSSSVRDDDGNIFCDANCALRYYGYTTI